MHSEIPTSSSSIPVLKGYTDGGGMTVALGAHSPDDALRPGADSAELLVPPQHCEGGVPHLHAVKMSVPFTHGSSI